MLAALGVFWLLLCGHAIADYCLQSDFMATNKNRNFEPKGYNPALHGAKQIFWPYVLFGHAATHGFFVFLITNSIGLGVFETFAHALIDFGKCEKWYGIHADQWLHFICKLGYVLVLAGSL